MKLIRSSTDSVSRIVNEKARVAGVVDTSPLRRHFDNVTKPPSLGGGMRKAGIALIVTPDPFTSVPGVALLASSFVMKRREPASLGTLAQETRKVLREIQSLNL
ncbi:MAG: hypothetical protein ABSB29_09465 [Nitrososphaerales archaeon]|jgi:hypothetical protein